MKLPDTNVFTRDSSHVSRGINTFTLLGISLTWGHMLSLISLWFLPLTILCLLVGYGTGAVMAVPAHDERDFKFAKHFNIPCKQVILPSNETHDIEIAAWTEKEGILVNSEFLNGLSVKEAISKAIAEITNHNVGKGRVNYRLRDAVFGRQRYWGEPIPIFYNNETPFALDENELPLNLPEVDKYLPTEDGEPPLARVS